jgi:hypothetical protein
MSTRAHDFLFGAVDPAGTITLDKSPGALWVQAVFVAVFGFHIWAMVLPQGAPGRPGRAGRADHRRGVAFLDGGGNAGAGR